MRHLKNSSRVWSSIQKILAAFHHFFAREISFLVGLNCSMATRGVWWNPHVFGSKTLRDASSRKSKGHLIFELWIILDIWIIFYPMGIWELISVTITMRSASDISKSGYLGLHWNSPSVLISLRKNVIWINGLITSRYPIQILMDRYSSIPTGCSCHIIRYLTC